jgi:acetyl esterase/lipase
MSFSSSPLIAAGLSLALLCAGSARAAPRAVRDVKFARAGDSDLLLDLYLPSGSERPIGLIVWVHGGAWRAGSRASVDLQGLTERGWAIASVDYRLSTVARFPAQVHDIKAAIRYLRARAGEHGYPPERVVIAGSSAGGHLAALVGVSNRHAELEGSIGNDTRTSSDVQAIVSLYGASNLTSILAQSTPHGLSVRVPALELLLGAKPEAAPALAQLASPVFHVDAKDPPLYLMHGDQDHQMPINQSHELEGAYQKLGLPVRFVVAHGAGHGGPAFTTPEQLASIDEFLRQQLALPRPASSAKR